MAQFRFSEIDVAIVDDTQMSVTTTRSLLRDLGMREFTIIENIDKSRDHLASKQFDLLVMNSHLQDIEIAPLVHDIRQGDLGLDPFVPVISLAWEPSLDLIQQLCGVGVDVILTLPLTIDKISHALELLIQRRRPFVVTADYIGPDRRNSVRTGLSGAPTTSVPNRLKRKAVGKDDAPPHELVVSDINDYRVESYISRITFSVGKISGLTSSGGEGTMRDWIEQLRISASNLSRRIDGTRYSHQSALCRSLMDVTDNLVAEASPTAADMELLQQIALALEITIKQEDATTLRSAHSLAQNLAPDSPPDSTLNIGQAHAESLG